ncbi:MAG: DUF3419 family protein [Vulcanimicrobiota bacterium]
MSDWVEQAAGLPVAFAVVREDPRLDLEVLNQLGPRPRVIMIASGGDTALRLARQPLGSLTLVDLNPAQLELVRLKWLVAREPRSQALTLLGHAAGERSAHLSNWGLRDGRLGPFQFLCELGLDYCGRYEAVFRDFQRHRDFQRSFALTTLVRLFGQAATRNPRRSFASHFEERSRLAGQRADAHLNPFLSQVVGGRFPQGVVWDWLSAEHWHLPLCEPNYRHGEMHEVLRTLPDDSADYVHLSNILDWLDPEQATAVLSQAARVLAPGGVVLLRQLNSSLNIPDLAAPLDWDGQRGADLLERDRSYFYSQVHWGWAR